METLVYAFTVLALTPVAFLGAVFVLAVFVAVLATVADALVSLYEAVRGRR